MPAELPVGSGQATKKGAPRKGTASGGALLAAYLYVHATTTWLGARKQAWLHLAVVSLPLLLFVLSGPLAVPSEGWAPSSQSNPIFLLLGLMLVAVGLPFFAIAATNPLIQRWLSD